MLRSSEACAGPFRYSNENPHSGPEEGTNYVDLYRLGHFEIQRLPVKYGLTFAQRKLHELWGWMSWKTSAAYFASRNYLVRRRRELTPSMCSILSTFSVEAAVLILVFPPLEFFLARRGVGENSQLATGTPPIPIASVMKWSVILCLGLLAASIWLKEIALRRGADEGED